MLFKIESEVLLNLDIVIKKKISAISAFLSAQQAGGRGEVSLVFLKIGKNCSDFETNYAVCVHLWVKFSFEIQF